MLILYHKSDCDGVCSAAVALRMYPEAEAYGMDYGDPVPWGMIEAHEDVLLVDFYLEPANFSNMRRAAGGRRLTWVDHHVSQIQDANAAGFKCLGSLRPDVAACEQTWRYFYPDTPVPRAVHLLSLYDTWKLQAEPDVLPFQMGFRLYPASSDPRSPDWEVWLSEDPSDSISAVATEGQVVLRYQAAANARLMHLAYEVDFAGHRALAVNAPFLNSQAFATRPGYKLYVAFSQRAPKRWAVSLYSDELDVSKIAQAYGGGGHRGASGLTCERLPWAASEG